MLSKAILNAVPGFQRADALKQLWNEPGAWSPYGGGWYIGWNKDPVTGQTLTAEDVLYCSVAYRCMTLIGGSVGSLPRYLYREHDDDNIKKAKTHPNYKVISIRPNLEQTWAQYDMTRVLRYFMYGNSYDQKLRNDRGDIIALNPLHPANMEVRRNDVGELIYRYSPVGVGNSVTPIDLAQARVHHIAAPSVEGIVGISTCALAQKSIQILRDFDEFTQRFLHNDATPPFVFSTDAILKPEKKEEIWENWVKNYKGLKNKFKAGGVFDGGLKPVAIPVMSGRDAENDASIRRNIESIIRYFGVQAHKVGLLERSTNNNIQQQSLEYLLDCLTYVLTQFQQCTERDFLRDDERVKFFVEYDVDSLQWADVVARDESLSRTVLAGIRKINEARSKLKLNPDPHGDVLLIPTANAPNGIVLTAPAPAPGAAPPEKPAKKPKDKTKVNPKDQAGLANDIYQVDVRKVALPLFQDACVRAARVEREYLEESVKRLKAGKPLLDCMDHAKAFYSEAFRKKVQEIFTPVVVACSQVMPEGPGLDVERSVHGIASNLSARSTEWLSTFGSTEAVENFCKHFLEPMAKNNASYALENFLEKAGGNHV